MYCQACGAENPNFHAFCYKCGGALKDSKEQPEHFRQEMRVPHPRDLEPELKKVSVLFVDITNSVHLIHKLRPEDSAEYLEPTLNALKQGAHRYGGMINRVDGDGMMVIFGAPIAYEDHAVRACYAALDMLKAVKSEFDATHIGVRVGIHSGEVLMKPFYNDFSVDYEALGPTVYLAHRMEVLASPNTAIISRETYRLAQKHIKALDTGPTLVKGLDQPVHVFQLQSRVSQQTEQVQRVEDVPFIARHNELHVLEMALNEASQLHGRCVAVCAEPGVGKSRLVNQFSQAIDREYFQLIETACDSHNRNTAYLPFTNILRYWLSVQETDKQLDIAQKLRDRVARMGEELVEHLSAFHFLLDLPIQNQTWNSLEPVQKRMQAQKAIRALLGFLSQHKPLILVLEDLHWIDVESQMLLEKFVEFVQSHSILLITTFRPEYQANWLNDNVSLLELKPFSDLEALEYLRSILGPHTSMQQVRGEIARRCEGIPLYMEEMIHHLQDSHLIWGEQGNFQSSLDTLPDSLPVTIHSVISTRIDRRSKMAKSILQAASVIGQRFSASVLDYVTDIPREYARHAIAELIQAGLVMESGDPMNEEYHFKHALIHQVTYDAIPRERKRLTHASLVNAIESLYKERLEEHIYRLAEHAYLGQYWYKAVEYYLKACYHAIGRSSHHQAVLLLDRGLDALRHLPLNQDTLGQRIDFLAVGMNALVPLGEQDRLVRDLREAEKLCAAVGEPKRTCSILCQLTNALWMVGKHDEAQVAARTAVEIAQDLHYTPLLIASQYNLAMVCHAQGNYEDTIAIEEKILATLSGELETRRFGWSGFPSVFARTFLGNSLVELGKLERAEQEILRGVHVADQARHPYSQAMIYDTWGYYLNAVDRFVEARTCLDTALMLCEEYAVPTMIPAVSAKLGEALIGCGELHLASKVLEAAAQPSCYRKGGRYTWFYLFKALANLHLAQNDPEQARQFAQKAYNLTQETGEAGHHGWSSLTLARVYARQMGTRQGGNAKRQVDSLFDQALDIAQQKGMHLLGFHAAREATLFNEREADAKTQLGYFDLAEYHGRFLPAKPFSAQLNAVRIRVS